MKTRSVVRVKSIRGGHKGQRSGCTHMDEANFPEDTTWKQQEDLPHEEGISQTKWYNNRHLSSDNDVLDISDKINPVVEDQQEEATHRETCRSADTALTRGKMNVNAVKKKYDKAAKGNLLTSRISDILQHHLYREEWLRGKGISPETLLELSNANSFDEAIVNSVILHYAKSSWPKEQTSELTGQRNPQTGDEGDHEPSCSPPTAEESASELEEPVAAGGSNHPGSTDFLTETKSPCHTQKDGQGQTPQNQQVEETRSGHRFKYDKVHYLFSDFSSIVPKGKMPENNTIDKPLPIDKPASLSPELRDRLALVQDILESMSRSNCAEKEEQKRKTFDPFQQTEMQPTRHVQPERLTGMEPDTSLFKLTSTSQKDPPSSSSVFQKISQGKKMCQKLKEQTERLKSKVQEFSKSMVQNSPSRVQDKRLVLEKLQGHRMLLEQELVANKEKHPTAKQQVLLRGFLAAGGFHPERKMEGEIFKLKMLPEEVKERIEEGPNVSASSLPWRSLAGLADRPHTSSPPSNEDPRSPSGRQARAERADPTRESCVFCHRVLEWKQNMEKKGHKRINCGRFPVALQEKVPHSDWILSPDTEPSCYSACGTGLQRDTLETCSTKIPDSPWACRKEPLGEFHYRYNVPGQSPSSHGGQSAFVQLCFLNENKNSSPSCSKPNRIYSEKANSKSSQDEHESIPGKKHLPALMACSAGLAAPAPQLPSCGASGSFSSIEETKSEGLNSSLDNALRTAISLKETTDRMIRTIAEDLAKVKGRRNRLKY